MPSPWMPMTYFELRLPNRPGELARFADRLHAADINLLGLWGYAEGEEPRLVCVPDIPNAFEHFAKNAGLGHAQGRTMYLRARDEPGALVETLDRIAAVGINVESIECVSTGDSFGWFIWANKQDMDALEELLK